MGFSQQCENRGKRTVGKAFLRPLQWDNEVVRYIPKLIEIVLQNKGSSLEAIREKTLIFSYFGMQV